MTPSPSPSKPVVKLVYTPESRDDALLAGKTLWSCVIPVSIANLLALTFIIVFAVQGAIFTMIFPALGFLITALLLFFAIPAEISSRRNEETTQLRPKLMRFIIKTTGVGSVSAKQVNALLTKTTIKVKHFTFIPFEHNGVAGIAVSEGPKPQPPLTQEQEYARVKEQYPEAEIII